MKDNFANRFTLMLGKLVIVGFVFSAIDYVGARYDEYVAKKALAENCENEKVEETC